MAMPDPSCPCDLHYSSRLYQILAHRARPGREPASSWIMVGFITAKPQLKLPVFYIAFLCFNSETLEIISEPKAQVNNENFLNCDRLLERGDCFGPVYCCSPMRADCDTQTQLAGRRGREAEDSEPGQAAGRSWELAELVSECIPVPACLTSSSCHIITKSGAAW